MTTKNTKEIDFYMLNELYLNMYLHRELFKQGVPIDSKKDFSHIIQSVSCDDFRQNCTFIFDLLREYKRNSHLISKQDEELPLCSFIEDPWLNLALNLYSSKTSNLGMPQLLRFFNITFEEHICYDVPFEKAHSLCNNDFLNSYTNLFQENFESFAINYLYSEDINIFIENASIPDKKNLINTVSEMLHTFCCADEFIIDIKISSCNDLDPNLTKPLEHSSYYIVIYSVLLEEEDQEEWLNDLANCAISNLIKPFFNLVSLLNKYNNCIS